MNYIKIKSKRQKIKNLNPSIHKNLLLKENDTAVRAPDAVQPVGVALERRAIPVRKGHEPAAIPVAQKRAKKEKIVVGIF